MVMIGGWCWSGDGGMGGVGVVMVGWVVLEW